MQLSTDSTRDDLFFEDVISASLNASRRVERGWLTERVQEEVSSPNQFLLLVAEQGFGKTDAVCVLAQQHPDWLRYFLRRDQTRRAGAPGARAFLCHIGLQLAALHPQLFSSDVTIRVEQNAQTIGAHGSMTGVEIGRLTASPFGKAAIHIAQNAGVVEGGLTALRIGEVVADQALLSQEDLAEMALLRPARTLLRLEPKRSLVVLLDALDEIRAQHADDHLLNWLAGLSDIPANLRFAIASRPDERLLQPLRDRHGGNIEEIRLSRKHSAFQVQIDHDLTAYARHIVELPQVAASLASQDTESEVWVETVVSKADGNLGYLVALGRSMDAALTGADRIAGESRDALQALLNLRILPVGLSALYGFLMRQIYTLVEPRSVSLENEEAGETITASLWPEVFDRILGVLCVARTPLAPNQIKILSGIRASDAQLWEALRALSAFLQQREGRYQFFHITLPEFLTDAATATHAETAMFAQNTTSCHRKIANSLLRSVGLPLITVGAPRESEPSIAQWQSLNLCGDYGWEHIVGHIAAAEVSEAGRWLYFKRITQAEFFEQRRHFMGNGVTLRAGWNADWEIVLKAGQCALDFAGVVECGLRRSELQQSRFFSSAVQTLLVDAIILARTGQDEILVQWHDAVEQQKDEYHRLYLKTHLLEILSRYRPLHPLCAPLTREIPELLLVMPPSEARDSLWRHFGEAIYPTQPVPEIAGENTDSSPLLSPQKILEQLTSPLAQVQWLCHWAKTRSARDVDSAPTSAFAILKDALAQCDTFDDKPDLQGAFMALALGESMLNQNGGTFEALEAIVEATAFLSVAGVFDNEQAASLFNEVHARYRAYFQQQPGIELPLNWRMQEVQAFASVSQQPHKALQQLLDQWKQFEPPDTNDDTPENFSQAMYGRDVDVVEELQDLIKTAPLTVPDEVARGLWAKCVQKRWPWVAISRKLAWLARDLALTLQACLPNDGAMPRPGTSPFGALSSHDFEILQDCLRPLVEEVNLKWVALCERQADDTTAADTSADEVEEEIRQAQVESAYGLEIEVASWLAIAFSHLNDSTRSQEQMQFVREHVPLLNWTPHPWPEVVNGREETFHAITEAAYWCGQNRDDSAPSEPDDLEAIFAWLQDFLPRAMPPQWVIKVCQQAVMSAARVADVERSRRAFDGAVALGNAVLTPAGFTALALLQMAEVYGSLWRSTASSEWKQRSIALNEEASEMLRQLQPTRTISTDIVVEAFCFVTQNFLCVEEFDRASASWAQAENIIRANPYFNFKSELICKATELITQLYAWYPAATPETTEQQTPESVTAQEWVRGLVASLLELALSIEADDHALEAASAVAQTAIHVDASLGKLVPVRRLMRRFRALLKSEHDREVSRPATRMVESALPSIGIKALLDTIPVVFLTGCFRTAWRNTALIEEIVWENCDESQTQGHGAGKAAHLAVLYTSLRSPLMHAWWEAHQIEPDQQIWPDETTRELQTKVAALLQATDAPEELCQVELSLATFALHFGDIAAGLEHWKLALNTWQKIAHQGHRERPFKAIFSWWALLKAFEDRLQVLPDLREALWHLPDNIGRETAEARVALTFLDSPAHYEEFARSVTSPWGLHPLMNTLDVAASDKDIQPQWLIELVIKVSREQPSLFAGMALKMLQASVRAEFVAPEVAHSTLTRLAPYLQLATRQL